MRAWFGEPPPQAWASAGARSAGLRAKEKRHLSAPAMNWGTSAGLLRMDSEPTPIPFDLLAAPAQRALRGAGYVILDQLTTVGATELASLHGFGPSAINTLRQVLAEHEMSFAGE